MMSHGVHTATGLYTSKVKYKFKMNVGMDLQWIVTPCFAIDLLTLVLTAYRASHC